MTREQARESAQEDRRMAELKEAYADGANIQHMNMGKWVDDPDPDFTRGLIYTHIKPKPVFRYWSKPEDVPVGRAVMRGKTSAAVYLITGADREAVFYSRPNYCIIYPAINGWEHAMIQPDGTLGPWLPCGKEEV